ncbi:MAG TPA: VWA domain-containing protein [Silvibacterium sp.]|nr:VWA domain-containing protein [Silvibacterium sp.]
MMRSVIYAGMCAGFLLHGAGSMGPAAQESKSHILVNVDLVQLNVAVVDRKGNYVTGLRPENFEIKEDNSRETISSFEEGGEPQAAAVVTPTAAITGDTASAESSDQGMLPMASRLAGANVFVLFDTSNYMYRGFVYAQDAIAGFVRSMQDADKIAFYSYSRDLSRATALTANRSLVMNGVRSSIAGDQAALYNCLLLTVRDASKLRGRKAIVVFSNGPDDSSTVPPEDVEELAQSTGTIIYIISTRAANEDPLSTAVFQRMSKATGGKAYFAKDWRDEKAAFGSIRSDLAHLYTITYYPKANKNRGWRRITVKLVGKELANDRVRTRDGYRVQEAEALPDPVTQQRAGDSKP